MAKKWTVGRAVKWMFGLGVAVVAALAVIGLTVPPAPHPNPVFAAAFAKAKAGFPQFWERYNAPQPGDRNFEVLARVTVDETDRHEYIWVSNFKRNKTLISGQVNSQPRVLTEFTMGKPIGVHLDQLYDWQYTRDGKIYGAATIRARLDSMPKNHADVWRIMLAPE